MQEMGRIFRKNVKFVCYIAVGVIIYKVELRSELILQL